MTANVVEGYAAAADGLFERYDRLGFENIHAPVLDLFPDTPCTVADIGAGSGRDAAYFADLGWKVVAVEPAARFRELAMEYHPSPRIEWIDDRLPKLEKLLDGETRFDVIMLTGVWQHLTEDERAEAMPALSKLLRKDGLLIMALRHGLAPDGCTEFEINPADTVVDAKQSGLDLVLRMAHPSVQQENRDAGVTWTRVAFRNPGN